MDKTDFVRSEECEGYPGIAHDFEKMRQINRELVEALEMLIFAHANNTLFSGSGHWENARAALAKAKGEA